MAILEKLPDDLMDEVNGGYIEVYEDDPRCSVIDDDLHLRACFETREEAEAYALKNGWSTETITIEERAKMLGLL